MYITKKEYDNNAEKISKLCGRVVQKHLQKINYLNDKIKEIQDSCPHYGLIEKNVSNTGNWDRNDDCYWTNFKCPHCGKGWIKFYE